MTDMYPAGNQPGFASAEGTPPTETRRMPGTARSAMWLLYALAAVMVVTIVGVVWDLATWGTYVDRVASSVGATAAQVSAEKSDNVAGDVVAIIFFAIFAALYALAAVLCRFAKRAGQIIAFVAIAPLLACGILPFVPGTSSALEDAAANQQPGLFNVLGATTALLPLPIGMAVFVLLLTRSGRSFFRRMPPAPPGYMYVPAQWSVPGYGGAAGPWVYPTYGPAPGQGQPPMYPPPGYPPVQAGYPQIPQANPGQAAPNAEDAVQDTPPAEPTEDTTTS